MSTVTIRKRTHDEMNQEKSPKIKMNTQQMTLMITKWMKVNKEHTKKKTTKNEK